MKTLTEEWEEFRRDNIPDLPDEEAEKHRLTFYCGVATCLIKCVKDSYDMLSIKKELQVFFHEVNNHKPLETERTEADD